MSNHEFRSCVSCGYQLGLTENKVCEDCQFNPKDEPFGGFIQFTVGEQQYVDSKNPKYAQGIRKFTMCVVPACVLGEVGVAMLEGAYKYGAYNYRQTKIDASTYYDSTMRHVMSWWEGEDMDPDSGLHHITKAITSLVVLRDSMINDMIIDDRPPAVKANWKDALNAVAANLHEKYGDKDV